MLHSGNSCQVSHCTFSLQLTWSKVVLYIKIVYNLASINCEYVTVQCSAVSHVMCEYGVQNIFFDQSSRVICCN